MICYFLFRFYWFYMFEKFKYLAIDEKFQKMVIFVELTNFRKTKYADWLRSIFYCYLLSEN